MEYLHMVLSVLVGWSIAPIIQLKLFEQVGVIPSKGMAVTSAVIVVWAILWPFKTMIKGR